MATTRASKFDWEVQKEPEELVLLYEQEAVLKYLDPKYKGHAEHVGAMVAAIRHEDNDESDEEDAEPELTVLDVFNDIQGNAVALLFEWMRDSCKADKEVKREDVPLRWEFVAFLGESLLRSCLSGMTASQAREWIMGIIPIKCRLASLLPKARFDVIQQHVQPFAHQQPASESSLHGAMDPTRSLGARETLIFAKSVHIFLNSSTLWSKVDEQAGTQTKDNPCPSFMPAKNDTMGHKADAAATAQSRAVIMSRFNQQGQNQAQSVNELLSAIAAAGGNCQVGSTMCCDSGYTKMALVEKAAEKGVGVIGIVQNNLKEHPFKEEDGSTIAPSTGMALATATVPDTASLCATAIAPATAMARGAIEGEVLPAPAAAVATPARARDSHDQRAIRRQSKRRADKQDSAAGGDGESPRQRRRGAQASERMTSSPSSSSACPSPLMREQGLGMGVSEVGTAAASFSCVAVAPSAGLAQSGDAATAPIVDLTSNTGSASSANGRRIGVDLDRHLGPMIYTAIATIKGDCGQTSKVYALGVRDHTVQDDKAKLVKFYCTGSGLPLEDLTKTYTVSPYPTGHDVDVKRWLWHPKNMTGTDKVLGDSVVQETADVQDRLKEVVVPLTAGQRSADWYILRRFLFTGTTSGVLAKTDLEARKLLLSADAPPVERMDKKAAFKELTRGWSNSRSGPAGHETKDMRSGTANETRVADQLVRKGSVKQFFDIGLVQSKQHSFMGVSADGIAIVEEPQTKEEIMVAVEIKTKVAPNALDELARVVNQLGASYVTCAVGDALWFKPFMADYRAQLIHQSVVLGLDHVLLVLANVSEVKLLVLVTVPAAARATYVAALERYKSLVTWAHDVADGTQSRTAFAGVEERDKAVMISHLPMWTALRQRVMRDGPVLPIRLIRSLVQMMHSKAKPGVDGITQSQMELRGRKDELRWHQMMFFTFFHELVVNSWTAWRHYKVTEDPAYEWKGIDNFRRQCDKVCSLNFFAQSLGFALLDEAWGLRFPTSPSNTCGSSDPASPRQQPGVVSTAEIDKLVAKRPKKGRPAWFDTPDGRALRSATVAGLHAQVNIDENKVEGKRARTLDCLVCGGSSATIKCTICGVALHKTKHDGTGCWSIFHGPSSILEARAAAEKAKATRKKAKASGAGSPISSPGSDR